MKDKLGSRTTLRDAKRVMTLGAPVSGGAIDVNALAESEFLVLTLNDALPNERQFVAGAGLVATDGGAGSTYTLDVVAGDTSIVVAADSLAVGLATPSGLAVSSGLMIADSVAGAGLVIASKVLAVGAGDGLVVNADDVALNTPGTLTASTGNVAAGNHTHAIDGSIARSTVTITAGAGLVGGGDLTTSRTLNVVAGDTSIVVAADSLAVGLATPSGLAISSGLMLADSVAGAGLVIASKVLAVGAGDGITVAADTVGLMTPGTLTVSSANVAAGNHTHAITTSSNPGAAANVLASAADGGLQLLSIGLGVDPDTDNFMKVIDGGGIGIGAAAGRLVFTDAATDVISVVDAVLGVGTETVEAGAVAEFVADGSSVVVFATAYQTSASGNAAFHGRRARGSKETPVALNADDTIVAFGGRGYDGAGFANNVAIIMYTNEALDASSHGTYMSFDTTPDGSTVRTRQMRLGDKGELRLLGTEGSILFSELSTTPPNPSASDQGRLYVRGDNLVIQYNDAGTMRYKYLDLTGTGITWVHSTTPP